MPLSIPFDLELDMGSQKTSIHTNSDSCLPDADASLPKPESDSIDSESGNSKSNFVKKPIRMDKNGAIYINIRPGVFIQNLTSQKFHTLLCKLMLLSSVSLNPN